MSLKSLCVAAAAMLYSQLVLAQGYFLPATDSRLRDDVVLIVDEGVINLPTNAWPIPTADLAKAVSRIKPEDIGSPALRAALMRVQARVKHRDDASDWKTHEISVTAGEPGLLRTDATLGRESFELHSEGGAQSDRYNINISVSAVANASDDKTFRLDGSDISIRWGNWLFSANQMERWWGPGRDGSLILSTNARPMPGVSLDRIRSEPFDFPVLRWLGPWRFTGFISVMDSNRADFDHPLFMGMRVSFKPLPILEFGLSRTAQFCGKGRTCDLKTIGNMLLGQDNLGIRGLKNATEEPGNQMAGADVKLVSPFRSLPLAVDAQLIGEDNSSSSIPERYLAQFGAESWHLLESGSVLRARVEYANTKCKWDQVDVFANCAYRQHTFFAGYRYYSRNVGSSTDADSETFSAAFSLIQRDGQQWRAELRNGRLDRYGPPDPYNPLTKGASDYKSLELTWGGVAWAQNLGIQLGYENQSGSQGKDQSGVFGFIQWRKAL
ncbi:MAG: capsule assembly Wzi family protein [Pseudomonadota bacterium]